jgi:hypothetical protein
LIGWRRVTAEPAITVAVTMAAALAVSIAFQASTLTASVDRLLDDKAEMLVGSDLAIMVLGSPPTIDGLGAASTEIVRTRSDDRSVRILGIDPDTFADVAYWRDDARAIPLEGAVAQIADGDVVTAVLVDPEGVFDEPPTELSIRNRDRTIDVVATADFFPGYKNGSPMLVVTRSVADDRGDREIWVREPGPDAGSLLRDNGGEVTSTFAPADVFDGTNFLSAKWAYDTLTVFAIVLGVVTLMAQALVLEARRRSRQAARVLTRPMGATRRDETLAVACEVGAPLISGGVLGAVVGWVVARLALGRLDSLRTLQPPADLVVDPGTLLFTAVAIVVATGVLAAIGGWRADRADPMEVMRVVDS